MCRLICRADEDLMLWRMCQRGDKKYHIMFIQMRMQPIKSRFDSFSVERKKKQTTSCDCCELSFATSMFLSYFIQVVCISIPIRKLQDKPPIPMQWNQAKENGRFGVCTTNAATKKRNHHLCVINDPGVKSLWWKMAFLFCWERKQGRERERERASPSMKCFLICLSATIQNIDRLS